MMWINIKPNKCTFFLWPIHLVKFLYPFCSQTLVILTTDTITIYTAAVDDHSTMLALKMSHFQWWLMIFRTLKLERLHLGELRNLCRFSGKKIEDIWSGDSRFFGSKRPFVLLSAFWSFWGVQNYGYYKKEWQHTTEISNIELNLNIIWMLVLVIVANRIWNKFCDIFLAHQLQPESTSLRS